MAEALGVAAAVAGIVSLGLELFSRIVSYTDAVQSRGEDLDAISRHAKDLRTSLDVIKNAIPNIASKHDLAGDAVLAALKSGMQELKSLEGFVNSLIDPQGHSQSSKSTFKDVKKKLTYPSHRESLEALQQRLQRANVSLQIAIHALSL
jgi:hypothetical protein